MGSFPKLASLGPIQVIPPGLTGLLQLKQLGQLPSDLSTTVAGVIELRDWYLTARRVSEISLFGGVPQVLLTQAGGVGGFPFTFGGNNAVVPNAPNQIWYVEQLTVSVLPTGAPVATDLIRYTASLLGVGGTFYELGPDVADNALAARTRKSMCKADRGFWAFPGDTFQIQVFDILSTNGYTAGLALRATPCPI